VPLIEELERSGQWLFRWRSYLPLAFIALVVATTILWANPGLSPRFRLFWDLICAGLAAVGLAIRAYTVGHTPKDTSGRTTGTQQAASLNTTGAYSVVRHPLYLGNYFMLLGVALFPAVWWLALVFTLAYGLYYERIMLAEEAFLRERFGVEYLGWATETPAFVPDFTRYVKPVLPFSLRNVLRREYNGAYGVVVVLTLLDVASQWRVRHHPAAHARWVRVFVVASVLWLVAITVKRRTRWLHVAGR
jgi:protein-S-isoprenylcysteine O-methyltransferase Ste14